MKGKRRSGVREKERSYIRHSSEGNRELPCGGGCSLENVHDVIDLINWGDVINSPIVSILFLVEPSDTGYGYIIINYNRLGFIYLEF